MIRLMLAVLTGSLLAGCATVIPIAELRQGLSISDVKSRIVGAPVREVELSVRESETGDLVLLEYNGTTVPGQAGSPHFFVFFNGALALFGPGDARAGELEVFSLYYTYAAQQGTITFAESERMKWSKVVELYGSNISPSYKAYFAGRVELAQQFDDGKITEAILNRRLAESSSELAAELEQVRQAAAVQRQAQINQSLLMMGLGAQLMQSAQPTYRPTIHCTTTQQGIFTNTSCR